MRHDEFLEIVKNGETSKVEFKTEDVHPNSLAEEIVALANFEGGMIFIGVDDAGEIKGYSRPDMEAFVINICRNNIKPSFIPLIEKIVIDDAKVMIVGVPRGETAYSTNRGIYYIRVGSTKQTPSQQELLRLFQKKNMLQFDEMPVLKASIDSINIQKANIFLLELGQSALNGENRSALIRELVNLSILVEIDNSFYPSLGGILAFGKNPQTLFPSYTIRCGAYMGTDFLSDTLREKDLSGTLDELIEDAIAFLKMTMPQQVAMEQNIRRKEEYLYPIRAIREAIVNAVCHRDYTISGSSIRFFLFSDHLEIRSPGGLPNTMTVENILYRQFTRNQMIASFLTGYGYMERRGKGIMRMLRLCRDRAIQCDYYLTDDKSEFVISFRPTKPIFK